MGILKRQTAVEVDEDLDKGVAGYEKSLENETKIKQVEESIPTQVGAAIAKVIADAPESFDTLKEIADWIEKHKDDASAMNTAINKNTSDIAILESEVASIKDYQNDAIGVEIDYDTGVVKRLGLAAGRTAGLQFNALYPFGQMKRCNLADDGTVNAYYGESGYTEDGSNGQVMVEIPKFYYRVEPINYARITDGQGYHIKKARYWVSDEKFPSFKIHPAFINENGEISDKIYFSAFEGSLYDASQSLYLIHDEQVLDVNADMLSSVSGVKPASGLTQQLTRPNLETIAKRRGARWHVNGIKTASMVQLLMLIELAGNFQTVLGQGVVSITDNSAYSCTSLTGSTSSLGNDSGMATETVNEIGDVRERYTNNGRVAVSYRGIENPYGNIWEFVYGINIHGNGNQKGGIPYIANDFNWVESKNSDNYESAGFTLTNANGYVKYFGYGTEDFDWIFMPSEVGGTSGGVIGDYEYVTTNLNGYRVSRSGGCWADGAVAGGFDWVLNSGVGTRIRYIGGRLTWI